MRHISNVLIESKSVFLGFWFVTENLTVPTGQMKSIVMHERKGVKKYLQVSNTLRPLENVFTYMGMK